VTATLGRSPLAAPAARMRELRPRRRAAFGVALHTTGDGLPASAASHQLDPLALAETTYTRDGAYCPHYVVDGKGRIRQIVDELEHAEHIGRYVAGVDRRPQYLSGHWRSLLPPGVAARWQAAWPAYASPYHLFPGESPNEVYVGIELIPVHPPPAGVRFTTPQLASAAALVAEIGARHGWPAPWWSGARLIGHEDVGIIDRHDDGGGWDPGWLRGAPYFDFPAFRELVARSAGRAT
jgi:N-acetyl-anhydromuramyl-L-alanine amidase AmpD